MQQPDDVVPANKRFRKLATYIDGVLLEPARHMRLSYLPPLLVYLAAGISGLTAIAGTFFIKEYLNLSAEFLASLGFWVGLPWILKMPLGHLVDIIWKWKFALVYLGAFLIAISLSIMYGLIAHTESLTGIASVETWFVTSAMLAPVGYVIQDVVADAMTVEAVPQHDENGDRYTDAVAKSMHTTMQTLGRIAIISGTVTVALLNVVIFSDAANRTAEQNSSTYAFVYLLALTIPVISVLGVSLGQFLQFRQKRIYLRQGMDAAEIAVFLNNPSAETKPNYWIFGGSPGLFLLDPCNGAQHVHLFSGAGFLRLAPDHTVSDPPAVEGIAGSSEARPDRNSNDHFRLSRHSSSRRGGHVVGDRYIGV